MKFDASHLVGLVGAILRAGGSTAAEADLVANHLVVANLFGHDSHGVGMVPTYVTDLHGGALRPGTAVKLDKEDGSILVFDGARGYGRVVAGEMMAQLIERCRGSGLVLASLRNAHHLGRIGAFGEMAAEAGLISLHFVNVHGHHALVAPFGGRDARFSTDPICIAVPRQGERAPVVLDMATSRVAFGKVRVAHNAGRRLAPGLVLDKAGEPSEDPAVMFGDPRGALLPFGEHKGFGLAVMCELLAGALSGGGTMQPETPRDVGVLNNMLTLVVEPGRLIDLDWFHREMEAFLAHAKASPPRDPAHPVLVPGESERLFRETRARDGIEVDDMTWGEMLAAAESVGLTRSDLEAHK